MSKLTSTHTYVVLHVSRSTYEEIAKALWENGYPNYDGWAKDIDMSGIAINIKPEDLKPDERIGPWTKESGS